MMIPSHFGADAFVWLCPEIDTKYVQYALDNLLYLSRRADNPLYYLALVDERIASVDRPSSPHQRALEFNQFLIEDITEAFTTCFLAFYGYAPNYHNNRDVILAQVETASRTGNVELIAWSWLYYHYVLVNTNIGRTEFCKAGAIVARTLHRYQMQGVYRLTERLYWHETEAIKRLNKIAEDKAHDPHN